MTQQSRKTTKAAARIIRQKTIDLSSQMVKTIKGFKRANLAGFIIVEHEGNTHIQIVGNKGRAFKAMQTALANHSLLNSMAQFAASQSKVTVEKQEAPQGEEQTQEVAQEGAPIFAQRQEPTAEESASITQEEAPE